MCIYIPKCKSNTIYHMLKHNIISCNEKTIPYVVIQLYDTMEHIIKCKISCMI